MLDYISNNKEWIFSGIGVAFFIYLIPLLIRNLFKNKQAASLNKPTINIKSNNNGQETHHKIKHNIMSEEEAYRITKELNEMPPLHLDDITKNYTGINVDWLTEYYSASKKDNDLINVSLYIPQKSWPLINVRCMVNLSEYKQFSILKRKAKIRIMGKIAKFETYIIELSDVKLFFPN